MIQFFLVLLFLNRIIGLVCPGGREASGWLAGNRVRSVGVLAEQDWSADFKVRKRGGTSERTRKLGKSFMYNVIRLMSCKTFMSVHKIYFVCLSNISIRYLSNFWKDVENVGLLIMWLETTFIIKK